MFTLEQVLALAAEYSLTVRVSKFGKHALHVMFERAHSGARVLNFWPSTGNWRTARGASGKADDLESALMIAVGMAAPASERAPGIGSG